MKLSLWLILSLLCLAPLHAADPAGFQAPANNTRSYSAPQLGSLIYWDPPSFKGPVKSCFTEGLDVAYYKTFVVLDRTGRMISHSGGRVSDFDETQYSYDEHGNLIKEQYSSSYLGEVTITNTFYEYVYDALGYPIRQTAKDVDGKVLNVFELEYSDSGYLKRWETPVTEFSTAARNLESYDARGRLLSSVTTHLDDSLIDKRETVYDDLKHTMTEYNNWDGSAYNWIKKTEFTAQGSLKAWFSYGSTNNLISSTVFKLDGSGNVIKEDFTDHLAGYDSQTTYKYSFDRYGNPLSIECRIDGELDYESSCNMSYEYY